MKQSISCGLIAAFAALLPTLAHAEDTEKSGGVYVSGAAGVVLQDDQLINGFNAARTPRRIITGMDRGTAFNGAVGYGFGENDWGRVRGELEIGRLSADLKTLSLNGVKRTLIGKPDKSVSSTMLNVFYDTPVFLGAVRAEVGAGIGRADIDYNIRYNVTANGPRIEIPTNSSQSAHQYMAGLSGKLTDQLEIFGQFRYMQLKDHKVKRFNRTAGTLDSILDAEYSARSVMVGLRYSF